MMSAMAEGPAQQNRQPADASTEGDRQPPGPVPTRPPEEKRKLTPEEQMELYEKDLKENDWGHQPC